jgi:hypothetical protein
MLFCLLSTVVSFVVSTAPAKKEGDIPSVFVSLSGAAAQPLDSRFADLKSRLLAGHEEASWIAGIGC